MQEYPARRGRGSVAGGLFGSAALNLEQEDQRGRQQERCIEGVDGQGAGAGRRQCKLHSIKDHKHPGPPSEPTQPRNGKGVAKEQDDRDRYCAAKRAVKTPGKSAEERLPGQKELKREKRRQAAGRSGERGGRAAAKIVKRVVRRFHHGSGRLPVVGGRCRDEGPQGQDVAVLGGGQLRRLQLVGPEN